MDQSVRFEVRRGVSSSMLPDGNGVLLDANHDEGFSLNQVGLIVWSGLVQGATMPDIVDDIVTSSGADRQRVEADVDTLVETLLAQGLIAAMG